VNIFGGFLVTQRMLAMYQKKKKWRWLWTLHFAKCRRHARAGRGHPRLFLCHAAKAWMAGTSPAMTRI